MASVDASNSSVNLCSHVPDEWLVDSGATHHITSTLDTLVTSSAAPAGSNNHVHLPNGNKVAISHVGNICLLANQTVSNVLYLPSFKVNLVSVSMLTKELNCMVAFFS